VGGPGDEAAEAAKQLSVDLETFDSVDELETMGEHVLRQTCLQGAQHWCQLCSWLLYRC
jgi:hypothetical protein